MPESPVSGVNPRYPMPAYPRGWYGLCDSDELAHGELRTITAFGRDLVAVRAENGHARVFDAYCPHLGAHLGHGGQVVDGAIRCPFHAWEFSTGDGQCRAIPYAKRIPPQARLEAWPCEERNGLVLVYLDPDGKPPEWRVDALPELDDPAWLRSATLEWTVRTHVHEALENVFDTAHLKYVHGAQEVPRIDRTVEEPGKLEFEIRGEAEGGASDLDIKLWGLGVAVLRYKIEVPIFELDTMTPLDEERVLMRTRLYLRDLGSAEANEAVSREVAQVLREQFDADIRIFEHKRHVAEPLLCDGDGPIPVFRRWTEQFYR